MSYINGRSASRYKLGRTLFPTMIEYDLYSKQEIYIFLPAVILVLCSESGHWSETLEPVILVFNIIVYNKIFSIYVFISLFLSISLSLPTKLY
jgi:hypothetical protein